MGMHVAGGGAGGLIRQNNNAQIAQANMHYQPDIYNSVQMNKGQMPYQQGIQSVPMTQANIPYQPGIRNSVPMNNGQIPIAIPIPMSIPMSIPKQTSSQFPNQLITPFPVQKQGSTDLIQTPPNTLSSSQKDFTITEINDFIEDNKKIIEKLDKNNNNKTISTYHKENIDKFRNNNNIIEKLVKNIKGDTLSKEEKNIFEENKKEINDLYLLLLKETTEGEKKITWWDIRKSFKNLKQKTATYATEKAKTVNEKDAIKGVPTLVSYIYKFIIIIIIIVCIIIVVLNIINIIIYLYECFKEIGNLNHNNLPTGDTFRYGLFKYLFYIDKCTLPSIIKQYNEPATVSNELITISKLMTTFNPDDTDKIIKRGTDSFSNNNTIKMARDRIIDEIYDEKFENKDEYDKWIKIHPDYGWDTDTDTTNLSVEKLKEKDDNIKKYKKDKQIEIRDELFTKKNNNEPYFNIFFILRLNFFNIRLLITIINIFFVATLLLIILSFINNSDDSDVNIIENIIPSLTTYFYYFLLLSILFVIINIILYKFIYLNIYKKQLETFMYIYSLDKHIFKKTLGNYDTVGDISDGGDSIDDEKIYFTKNYYNLLKTKIDDHDAILKEIIKTWKTSDISQKNKVIKRKILLYILVHYIYNGFEKKKDSHLNVLDFFIDPEQKNTQSDTTVTETTTETEKKLLKSNTNTQSITYYSFISSKNRNEPIQYFKYDLTDYNDIIDTNDKEEFEKIKREINTEISILNEIIININKEFNDDYFIINYGIYFLINLVISVIYIIIIFYIYTNYKQPDSNSPNPIVK